MKIALTGLLFRTAQIEQLDLANLSRLSTETTAFTTSKTTSPQSEEREETKQSRNTVIPKSCTSPVAQNELANKEPIDFDLDLPSAPGNRTQNDFNDLPCSDAPATKSDS